ncbi:MAG: hypothetical protein JSS63_06920 [Bacteroidetes bacterium]|nr:hypothetical protein [Bacteroidota bacterium]
MKFRIIFLIAVFFMLPLASYAQVELVSPSHPVYDFLKRMQLEEIIDYNSSQIPISRGEIGSFLLTVDNSKNKISSVDKKILGDFLNEFEYDLGRPVKEKISSFFSGGDVKKMFSNDNQKYFYKYLDSNASFFVDGLSGYSYRRSSGDTLGSNTLNLSEIGLRFRGTLFNSVGFYLRASNGSKMSGDDKAVVFGRQTDPKLAASRKFPTEGYFDSFEGYLRYQTKGNWLGLTVGREAMYQGFGYIDKLYLSNNTVPFDFINLRMQYKALRYSFTYGGLKGDSLGRDIPVKNIATHRLDVNFSPRFRMGFWEALITASQSFSFSNVNPLSFLISVDYNDVVNSNPNNNLFGIDMEVQPVKNLALQGTMLVDEISLGAIFQPDKHIPADSKFGWQFGTIWTNAFSVPNLTGAVEFTHLDPFVYTHRSLKTTYTNWGMPLGAKLSPNSDEIALKLSYNITQRVKLDLQYQFQRSAEGIVYDSLGNVVINYGGNINNGAGDNYTNSTTFLQGNRINRSIATAILRVEPLKQLFLDFKFVYNDINNIFESRKYNNNYFFATIRFDY